MMRIHGDFVGGNIREVSRQGNTVYLENELRDTEGDWFYWAFCVEGAGGSTVSFRMQKDRVGYWGPAVSHDLETWHWLDSREGDGFTYTFAPGEDKVYFAHNMLYHPAHFLRFAERAGLPITELCSSLRGRSVPCIRLGDGERTLILTARHHACESTGSYVLEGVLDELAARPLEGYRLLCVPFVDYDGVVDGDQGKSRAPHDHNRDYDGDSLYPEVAAIRSFVQEYGCTLGFDFHSPWHLGDENDYIYIVRNSVEKNERIDRFAALLEKSITSGSMRYDSAHDHPPMTGWNMPSANFGFTMMHRPECDLAFSLENTYFGIPDDRVSAPKLVELGRCFARTIRAYAGQD